MYGIFYLLPRGHPCHPDLSAPPREALLSFYDRSANKEKATGSTSLSSTSDLAYNRQDPKTGYTADRI